MLLRPLSASFRSLIAQPGTSGLTSCSANCNIWPLLRSQLTSTRSFQVATPMMMGRRSSKIATRKTAQDMKKSKLYGKIGKLIVQAAKVGGPDPVSNTRLRDVLAQAKLVDCPKEIIERNLKKASDKQQADYTEVSYECYGHGGTGFIIECLTDNPVLTGIEVKQAVVKGGCKMADPGSVAFNFRRQGCIFVKAAEAEEDRVFDAATEAGAEDVQPARDEDNAFLGFRILSKVEDFGTVRDGVSAAGLQVYPDESGLVFIPLSPVEVDDAAFDKNEALYEKLLSINDVDAVHTNCAGLYTSV